MKNFIRLLIITCFIIVSCEKEENDLNSSLKGISIAIDDSVVVSSKDIDYYDLSSHLVYLKTGNSFLDSIKHLDTFKVFVDTIEVYQGVVYPGYYSMMPVGPVIHNQPTFYPDYIIAIDHQYYIDTSGNKIPDDPRSDSRLINALKNNNQLYKGLSCEITSIEYDLKKGVTLKLILKNNDHIAYLYLDPEKMGINLFHYYTNGLYLRRIGDNATKWNNVQHTEPDHFDEWEESWLSVIDGGESIQLTFNYENFDDIPAGNYLAMFQFPGLSYQVDKSDLVQPNGRIWLGNLDISKEITFE